MSQEYILCSYNYRSIILIMFIKVQFFKYVLCAVVYFIVCVVLIELKKHLYLKKVTSAMTIKYQPQIFHSVIADKIIKKNVELEIKMLQADELKGETIDVQVRNLEIYLDIRKYLTENI